MKFSEFSKSEKQAEVRHPDMTIGGSFTCQVCSEDVDEAEYFMAERILRWKCSEAHTSFIEGFSL